MESDKFKYLNLGKKRREIIFHQKLGKILFWKTYFSDCYIYMPIIHIFSLFNLIKWKTAVSMSSARDSVIFAVVHFVLLIVLYQRG